MALVALLALAAPAGAEPFRVAVWNVDLARDGPGLLLRDILAGDPQVEAAARVVAHVEITRLGLSRARATAPARPGG